MSDHHIHQAAQERYARSGLFRRSGRSGIMLPAVSLGLWKNFGAQRPFEESRRLLHYAFDHGIVHFDLANNYGPPPGSAEETLGHVVSTSLKPYRDELFIATKAGYEMWDGPYGNWGSRKSLMASIDQSLSRMRLDYVDLFYTHRYDPQTPLDETLQALADIVRAGKSLYVGISRWPLEATLYGLDYLRRRDVPCLCYQGRLNLLDRAPETEGILPALRERGCGFVSFSPLAQGLLAGRYLGGIPEDSRIRREATLPPEVLTPSLLGVLEQLDVMARGRGDTLAQLALKWVLAHEGVTSVIVGASRVEQLADSLQCLGGAPLRADELERMDDICRAL
ncbi:L-glyceraldehyde 3-phosphate reductase [Bacteroidaceae bacterium]|jgi:L-glyceraldehyde 3-phosphate reductase|nr:L-glyceraldehyde 3-phosphate reductase [Bacteroidaceae bacterium]